jgi:putative ATP-dependent endonuclease of the OLD family
LVAQLRATLNPDDIVEEEAELPTGIPESIARLLPEPVYIPVVKNLGDDFKTTDCAMFGKILGQLFNVVEAQLTDAEALFQTLERKLNRYEDGGTVKDERLDELKQIERVIERNLQENFPQAQVYIRIPPPDIKSILQNARLDVHDGGISGPIETKGDGLKRSVVFSIFRAYVELARQPGWQKRNLAGPIGHARYLFLFEEPELYLHPKAQRILFDALYTVAEDHQVIVTTHSPLFFSADRTTTFTKIVKRNADTAYPKPYSEVYPVDLSKDMPAKDAFQIITYENNNAAFFASEVVLVEGDSDLIVYKHIARLLNPRWDFDKGRVMMIRVHGKGSFRRFRDFFARFQITTHILTDLDFVVKDFDKACLPNTHPLHSTRSNVLAEIDKLVSPAALNGETVKDLFTKITWREKWEKFVSVAKSMKDGVKPQLEEVVFIDSMLEEELHQPRIAVLRTHPLIQGPKMAFLCDLRDHEVFVLARGSVEDYYPPGIEGRDKPARAESFQRLIKTRDDVLKLAEDVPRTNGQMVNEFEAIFGSIFREPVATI